MAYQITKFKQNNFQIPIFFQKQSEFEDHDTRFMNVKIWICHTGKNLNGSYFDKPVIEQAIPSLANTPILAFIEENSLGDKDFSDHRTVITKDNGHYKFTYIGWAVGVIPESNHAHFEMRLCDDGVEREFLVVDGLIWQNKWDDAPDIFNRDLVKAQSMELNDTNFDGFTDEDGYFHFTEFQFYGACCLGIDYQPAMVNSTIELTFAKKELLSEMQEKMERWKAYATRNQLTAFAADDDIDVEDKGGNTLTQERIDEILAEHNVTLDELSIENTEELTEEKLLEIIKEHEDIKSDEGTEDGEEFTVTQEAFDELKAEFDRYKETYCTPEEEVQKLRDFQTERLAQDRENAVQAIFSEFADLDEIEEFITLKENNAEFTLEALKEKCFTIRGKQVSVTFTKKSTETNKLPVDREPKTESIYGGLFARYGVTKED